MSTSCIICDQERNRTRLPKETGESTHRPRHNQVGLRVEVAAEHVVAVALQRLQTLPLQTEKKARDWWIRNEA